MYIVASIIRYKIGKIMFSKSTTHFEKQGIKTKKNKVTNSKLVVNYKLYLLHNLEKGNI